MTGLETVLIRGYLTLVTFRHMGKERAADFNFYPLKNLLSITLKLNFDKKSNRKTGNSENNSLDRWYVCDLRI